MFIGSFADANDYAQVHCDSQAASAFVAAFVEDSAGGSGVSEDHRLDQQVSFPQLGGSPAKLLLSWGAVTTGNPPSIANAAPVTGRSRTSARPAQHRSTFPPVAARACLPICSILAFNSSVTTVLNAQAASASQFNIATTENGVATNLTMGFIAIGFQ